MLTLFTFHVRSRMRGADMQEKLRQCSCNCCTCRHADVSFFSNGNYASTSLANNAVVAKFTPAKLYRGDPGGMVYVISNIGGQIYSHPLHHVENHSPVEFAWGYEGSGPADLAVSILCDTLGEWPDSTQLRYGWFKAAAYCQAFKREFVTHWRLGEPFEITSEVILAWLRVYGAER